MILEILFSCLLYGGSFSIFSYLLNRKFPLTKQNLSNSSASTLIQFKKSRSLTFLFLAMLLSIYPIEILRKVSLSPTYPIFKLENITLIDDTEDFLEIVFTKENQALGVYWDETEHQFLLKPLEFPSTFSGHRLSKQSIAPLHYSLANHPYYFRKNSPWIPLPLVPPSPLSATYSDSPPYQLQGNWINFSDSETAPLSKHPIFEFTFTPLTSPEIAQKKSIENPIYPSIQAHGHSHASAPSMLTLYTMSPHYLYYTTFNSTYQRYTIARAPLPNIPSESSDNTLIAASETFLKNTNIGHHYYPFYWAEGEMLSYLSIERFQAKNHSLDSSNTSNHSNALKNSPYQFQTVLHIKANGENIGYQKPLLFTKTPQLIHIKLEGDSTGNFLGYTSPLGEGILNFIYFLKDSTPYASANSNKNIEFSYKTLAFELPIPEMKAIHSFSFTPLKWKPGLIFIGTPAKQLKNSPSSSSSTQGNIYWGERVTTPTLENPLSLNNIILAMLCIVLIVIILSYNFLYRHRLYKNILKEVS